MTKVFTNFPDPYEFAEWAQGNPIGKGKIPAGKALRDPRLIAGERTGVFIVAGQSNAANYVNVAYSPTNAAKIDNLSLYDGGTYAAVDPLLGCEQYAAFATPGNMFLKVADDLITAGAYDRVILIPVAVGGSSVALWNTSFGDRLHVAYRRAKAVGLTVSGVLWQQGEADQASGTTQAVYLATLQSVIAKARAAGLVSPWFIAKCTYFIGAISVPVQNAQTAIINGTDIFAGANTDTITSSGRFDNGHFNATGRNSASTLWVAAIRAGLGI